MFAISNTLLHAENSSTLKEQCNLAIKYIDGGSPDANEAWRITSCFRFVAGVSQGIMLFKAASDLDGRKLTDKEKMFFHCPPKESSFKDHLAVVNEYLNNQKNISGTPESFLVARALVEAYPCE